MTTTEILKRYPLLVQALQYIMIASQGEAVSTIRLYLDGAEYGCEACSHAGRTTKQAIQQAFRCRQAARAAYKYRCERLACAHVASATRRYD